MFFLHACFFARIALERVSSGKARGKTALPSFLPSFQPPGSVELDTEKKQRKEKKEKSNYYKEKETTTTKNKCQATASLLVTYSHNSALSTPAPEQGLLDECSHDARRFRCEVGPREDRRERRRVMRDHHLRILAKDAVNRCGLGLHRQDAPPLAGVRKLGRPP